MSRGRRAQNHRARAEDTRLPVNEPVLVLQGGAGSRGAQARADAIAESLKDIANAVWPALQGGGSALDAVVDAVRRLEDDPLFNAGTGAKLQVDGTARLSASLMDGTHARFTGVVNVEGLANPIVLCRHLLDDKDRVLAGAGALARARELHLDEKDVRTPASIAQWESKVAGRSGTVGAVALDGNGQLAAATSTGGRGMERVGRVSDSCTATGNYATTAAAVSCTGIGEDIMDGALAVRIVQAVESGVPLHTACTTLTQRMDTHGWRAGLIAVDAEGRWSTLQTTEVLYWHTTTQHRIQSFQDD